MNELEKVVEETRSDEGYRARPYRDSLGRWTFANGRCLETRPLSGPEWKTLLSHGYLHVTISPAGADLLEQQDLAIIAAQLKHDDADFWGKLNAARQDALIEMAYQLGVRKEEDFHDMLGAVRVAVQTEEAADWDRVERCGLASDWYHETPARARRVMDQLRSGQFPAATGE